MRAQFNTPETDSERRAPRFCALGAGSIVFVVSENAGRQRYYFGRTASTGVSGSTVFVEPASSLAMEVLLLSSEMLGDAGSTLFALLSSIKWRPLFARQNKCFLRIADSRRAVLDDPTELLGRARIRFRSTKRVLLARKQFINNVWNCTRNGFGARKTPAERSSSPNVLYLSSGMPLRRSNHCIRSA